MATVDLAPLLIAAEKITDVEWNGIPSLLDLLAQGGYPGVEYCLIHPEVLGVMERAEWWRVPKMNSLTLHGPKGSADGVMLMAWGEPIPGASPSNGQRKYYARVELLVTLGYLDGPERADVAKLRADTEANKVAAAGAARHAVDNAHANRPPVVPGAR